MLPDQAVVLRSPKLQTKSQTSQICVTVKKYVTRFEVKTLAKTSMRAVSTKCLKLCSSKGAEKTSD